MKRNHSGKILAKPSPSTLRKKFSSNRILLLPADPHNGEIIDKNWDIVEQYAPGRTDTPELQQYYKDKEAAINRVYREESNLAAAAGTPVRRMEKMVEERDKMLQGLADQKDDIEELDYKVTNPDDSDWSAETDSDTNGDGKNYGFSDTIADSNNDGINDTNVNNNSNNNSNSNSNSNEDNNENNSNNSSNNNNSNNNSGGSYQDSSDITQTDFDPSDYYDD